MFAELDEYRMRGLSAIATYSWQADFMRSSCRTFNRAEKMSAEEVRSRLFADRRLAIFDGHPDDVGTSKVPLAELNHELGNRQVWLGSCGALKWLCCRTG